MSSNSPVREMNSIFIFSSPWLVHSAAAAFLIQLFLATASALSGGKCCVSSCALKSVRRHLCQRRHRGKGIVILIFISVRSLYPVIKSVLYIEKPVSRRLDPSKSLARLLCCKRTTWSFRIIYWDNPVRSNEEPRRSSGPTSVRPSALHGKERWRKMYRSSVLSNGAPFYGRGAGYCHSGRGKTKKKRTWVHENLIFRMLHPCMYDSSARSYVSFSSFLTGLVISVLMLGKSDAGKWVQRLVEIYVCDP